MKAEHEAGMNESAVCELPQGRKKALQQLTQKSG